MRLAGADWLVNVGVRAFALIPVLALLAGPVWAQQDSNGNEPVGWETYRQLDRLPKLSRGVSTRMFSSFDRTGDNNDGFQGTYSCLQTSPDGCVIAEAAGAGEIQSIWFTRDGGDVSSTGTITIELDGEVVLDASLQSVVNGDLGPPFRFPLVANADQSSGGVYLKVPMPYRESMRVTTEHNPLFYHVTYRAFDAAHGLTRFDPSDTAEDVVELLADAGTTDPKPRDPAAESVTSEFALPGGGAITLATLDGPGVISELRLRMPQLVGPRGPVADDGRAYRGASAFTVRVDPNNEGVRIVRRFGTRPGDQHARVLVDGEEVGEWPPRPRTVPGMWRDEILDVDAEHTAGKSQIRVRNEFISSALDINEFTYWVYSMVDGEFVPTDTMDVGPESLADEEAHDYVIEDQSWQGVRTFRYQITEEEQERVAPTDTFLRDARLRISFDGQTTVDAPVGEFFGSGLGEYEVRSLFFAMETAPEGWYSSWWPMPFRSSAVVELVNGSDIDIDAGEVAITWASAPEVEADLGADGHLGYFHASSRRARTRAGQDWVFVDTTGHGKLVGVSHTMVGLQDHDNIRGYLEGDERIYVDGSRSPVMHGTGSEDFYQGGWYFNRDAFSLPTNGNTAHEDFLGGTWGVKSGDPPADTEGTYGCTYSCDSAYRLLIGDAVPFDSTLRATMEHGPQNNIPGSYSSTTFWYGRGEPTLHRTDVIDVGDPESERAHAYVGSGATETLASVFEGEQDDASVVEELRAATAEVSFDLEIGEAPDGVVVRRMSDQQDGYQAARVFVGDEEVGLWLQPLSNATQRWREDAFTIPAAFTQDSSRIRLRLVPLDGAPAWRAARYEVLTYAEGTGVSTGARDVPQGFHLADNYPNPFRDETTIHYTVPSPTDARLAVYDVHGRLVHVLTQQRVAAGSHRVAWRPPSTLANGVYFILLHAGVHRAARPVVLVR